MRRRALAEESESGRSNPAEGRSSERGRKREKADERFWNDREITSVAEIGMVV